MTDTDTRATLTKFYGKYRGTCINNVDPMMLGRIQVIVPDVSEIVPSSWAMPCFPLSGPQCGVYAVPMIGAGIWVEFEQGDPDYPIWVGGYFGEPDLPVMGRMIPPGLTGFTYTTMLQNSISITDTPGPTGGILMKTTTGAMISVSDIGIIISNGKGAIINMIGPTVDINVGALTVI
jgi:hypothetical protein